MADYAVWKFELETQDIVDVQMPAGAKLLHVAVQHGTPCLWALVDTTAAPVLRRLRIIGTGHRADAVAAVHVGTYMLHGGMFVGHVFDLGEIL